MNRSLLFLLLAPILLIPAACGVGNDDDAAGVPTLPPYEDAALADYGIAVDPDPAVLAGLFGLGVAPVGLVHLPRHRPQ